MTDLTHVSRPPSAAMLKPGQMVILGTVGALLWFLAALLMCAIVPLDFYRGVGIMIVYAFTIPGTWPFVLLIRRLASLRADQTAIGVTIVTAAALLLDGTAFAFFPALYADNSGDAVQAAAAILWGAGVALVLGLLMNKADPT